MRAVSMVGGALAAAVLGADAGGALAGGPADRLQEATGRIEGEVRLVARPSRRLATPGAYPSRAVTVATTAGAEEVENVVLFVRAKPAAGAAPARVAIRQKNERFLPRTVALTIGSTVEFPNDDPFFHNVFSLSRIATFDLGRYKQGESRERRLLKPGIVKVFCHLHSHMNATIRVFDHPFFTRPDLSGRFEIAGLAEGRHEVVAWHERAGEVARGVTVVAGATARVSFALPVEES